MRGRELLDCMELVEPVYLEAADKRPAVRRRGWLKYGAAAACLCAILGSLLWETPDPSNAFCLKACALELAEDGSLTLKETDLLDQPDVWGGHFDGENFYAGVGLRYDGSNIDHVLFTTESGFFAKQYVNRLSEEENVSRLYVGPENRLVMYGEEFEIAGSRITLDSETMTDDLLLFWGTRAAGMREVPEKVTVKAAAVFRDGRTQELTVSLDLSGTGVVSMPVDEEEFRRHQARRDYYGNLPLEDCELLEESVERVTDVYEVQIGMGTGMSTSRITHIDQMEYDKDGIWRGGIAEIAGEVYIPVIRRETDGGYTGMLYRVPEELCCPAERR
ncbi:hypothetical protein [uncultured Oscillibacter sp.]|jgi:hypothetical protein|uniref:hypothetical protein n=1 Tax=uncultured Oscillibacter sp. TaxID=876091 RepID=UPI0025FE932A|nr:hypothetical protein [uncultured Oscillibacter sp.]